MDRKSIFNLRPRSDGGVDVDDSVGFAAKDRFELSYKDENGEENGEVFVIHRAPLSTHERFVAFLTEHWIGNFPTWLSPVQVQVITISENKLNMRQK